MNENELLEVEVYMRTDTDANADADAVICNTAGASTKCRYNF
jgi:hypothetical protein